MCYVCYPLENINVKGYSCYRIKQFLKLFVFIYGYLHKEYIILLLPVNPAAPMAKACCPQPPRPLIQADHRNLATELDLFNPLILEFCHFISKIILKIHLDNYGIVLKAAEHVRNIHCHSIKVKNSGKSLT